ncbi:phosphatase PAP2 family protein [Bordetella petrii]|uniref:phosphatase PAP2 family protein n=1 Tax=Bordetella petrii TaxID=94624 RepID=UPI00047D2AFB|nr:phosphatase PAP2 family protein [Bordetella petrii]
MEAFVDWVAVHPLLILLAAPAAAALCAWLAARHVPSGPGARPVLLWSLLAAGSGAVFLALAAAMAGQPGEARLDSRLASGLSLAMPAALLWTMSWFTYLGDRNLLTIIAVGMTVSLLWKRQWVTALACVAVTGGAGLLNLGLKHLFQRVRPEHLHGYASADGWSFPSGHTSGALAVYGFACYLAVRALPAPWRAPCVAGVAALVAAIGVSRVLLQVHYLSDVLAGIAISLAWLAACMAALSAARQRRAR